DLRAADQEAFNLLSTHDIEYRFHDHTCDIRTSAPVIEVDREGRLTRIRFNNWLRGVMVGPEKLIEPMYKALATFWRMLRNPKYRLDQLLWPNHDTPQPVVEPDPCQPPFAVHFD